MIIKPKALLKGDKVAIIAPSSPTTLEKLKKAEKAIIALGLVPKLYPSCYKSHGHFSGKDNLRATDINNAFKDDSIKAIIALKGGYGTPRILSKIDYDMIRNNPKIFLGYSDITGLHIAINKLSRIVTYHGPMASAGLSGRIDDYTKKYVDLCLFSNKSLDIINNPKNEELETLVPGNTTGELIGGNLSLLVSTLGSKYEIDVIDKILFIEDVGEKNYKIDRMLNSLALAGKFEDCAGVILGTFLNCKPDIKMDNFTDLSLETIFNEIIVPYNKPTIFNFRAGHNYPQPTLPFGVIVELNSTEKYIKFTESGNRKD